MSYDSAFGQFMHSVFGGFDFAVFSAFGAVQNEIFNVIAKYFTCLGEPVFIIIVGILGAILFFFKRTRKIGILLMFGIAAVLIINYFCLKNIFLRLRPYNVLQGNSEYFIWYMNAGSIPASPYCFPSSHTVITFCLATIICIWIKKDLKKPECWAIFIFPFFTACSRIYLMVHYPTDVIFGLLEGILIGIFVWIAWAWIDKYIFSKMKFLYNIDLEPWLEKKLKHKINPGKFVSIIVLFLICVSFTTYAKINYNYANKEHCSHKDMNYICMNEANTKVFNENTQQWENYCDIHK